MSRALVANDIDFLKDLPIYKDKVNFLINDEKSLVKESYRTFKEVAKDEDKTCPGEHTIINDRKSYDGNITEYTIRAVDDVIIDYHGKGPTVETNVEQITCSEKDFYNRRMHDIGIQLSTGEVKGSTIVDYHTKYVSVKDYRLPGFINMNVFRSDYKDPEHPALDMVINTEFYYDDNKENTATILIAREIRQRFHKNGELYDFKRSNMKYGYDVVGELIKIDTKAKELFEGDRGDIVPRLKIDDEGNYIIRYVSMDKPYDVHMIETYVLVDDAFKLTHITNNDQYVEIDFEWLPEGPENMVCYPDGCYRYTSTLKYQNKTCQITGYINRPNSGDLFMYTESKNGLSFSKLPYFQNIYAGEADGSYFLTNNIIAEAKIIDDSGKTVTYTYQYDENREFLVNQFVVIDNDEKIETAIHSTTVLPDGTSVHEIVINADPFDNNVHKKSKNIFYVATELDANKDIISQYRALIIND